MNFVHLHLLLNHVPTVATIIALGVLLLALAQKSDDLIRASFAVFFAIALVSLPTYMTGYSAEAVIKDRSGVNLELIALHQSSALLALTFMEATGVAAWFGLWQARKPAGRARGAGAPGRAGAVGAAAFSAHHCADGERCQHRRRDHAP